ncbi:MAG: ABC transporter ATP-binding protein [Chloroherpetonaceae bacterium]|nr:ABC transporter ATP-binding protein [Chloroherpetonaceae bacterium]
MAEQKTPQKGLQMDSDAPSGNVFDALLLRRLYRYVRPYPLLLASATLLTVLAALFSPLRPYLVKLAVDNHIAIGDTDGLMRLSALFLGVLCLEALTQFGSAYLTQLLGQKAVFNLRQELFAHVQRLALSFFNRNPIGRLMTRITNDVESLNEMLSSGLVSLLGDVFQLAFIIVMMLILDWQLTLVSFSVLPLMFWATMVFKKYVRVAYQDVRTEVARLNAFLQEHITGMMIVQLFSREQKEFEKHSEINAAH